MGDVECRSTRNNCRFTNSVELLRRLFKNTQIDPAQTRWRDLGHDGGLDNLAPVRPAVRHRFHLQRVPGHHGIGQQAQAVGHCRHFVWPLGLRRP